MPVSRQRAVRLGFIHKTRWESQVAANRSSTQTKDSRLSTRPPDKGPILTSRRTLILLALAGFAGVFLSGAIALSLSSQRKSTEPEPGSTAQQPPEGTIRVRVALVNAPVVVFDANGEPILDIEKDEFHVRDNGVVQSIESLDLGGEPLSTVLVFETSSRAAPVLPAVRKSAIVFTQTIVGPSGEAAVLGYDNTTEHLLPFTTDHDQLEKAISGLTAGPAGTRLYDSLSEAVSLLKDRPSERRRAIIVVGEARDDRSEDKLGEVLRQAQLANIVIYCVGLSPMSAALRAEPSQAKPDRITPPGSFVGPPFPGSVQTPTTEQQYGGNIDLFGLAEWAVRHVKAVVKEHPLEVTAAATGGTFQSVVRDRTLERAIDVIGGELNSQYILSYRPTGSSLTGYHHIQVTVDRPKAKVRSRPGYYLEGK